MSANSALEIASYLARFDHVIRKGLENGTILKEMPGMKKEMVRHTQHFICKVPNPAPAESFPTFERQ